MRTFSVDGESEASLDAAMASALMQVGTLAAGATKMEIAIAAAFQDGEGHFRVTVNVIAHEETDDLTEDAEDGESEGEGERENDRQHRRAEEISQELKENMMRQFVHTNLGNPGPDNMADSFAEGREMIEHAAPDTNVYVQDAESDAAAAQDGPDITDDEASFDTVRETFDASDADYQSTASIERDGGSNRLNVNVLSHEVDEVIGLFSLGFYEPPRPEAAQPVPANDERDDRQATRPARRASGPSGPVAEPE